jgi:hemerythrin-like metal-binding protein
MSTKQKQQPPALVWINAYTVGIDVLDTQHKELIRIVNQFHEKLSSFSGFDCLSSSGKRIGIYGTILSLRSYFLNHFSTEERFMMRSRYPDFFEHKKEHDLFVRKVFDFEDYFVQGKLNIAREMDTFLLMWVKKHTLEMDAKYKEHLTKYFGKTEHSPSFEEIQTMNDEPEETAE